VLLITGKNRTRNSSGEQLLGEWVMIFGEWGIWVTHWKCVIVGVIGMGGEVVDRYDSVVRNYAESG